jgi:hypothetical protein
MMRKQEARFVIEEIAPDANHYRLMDYNNDPNLELVAPERFRYSPSTSRRLRGAIPRSFDG